MFAGEYMRHLNFYQAKTLFYGIILFFCACSTTQKKDMWTAEKALEPVNFFCPDFKDDMARESLINALEKNLVYLKALIE